MTRPHIGRRGFMLVFSSPSGAGKTTISRRILESHDNIDMSISVTTRPRRPGEVAGKDYIFVDGPTFQEMRDKGEFLEWAKVFDHYYGTPRSPIQSALDDGRIVIFDIDWQGTQQVRDKAGDDLVTIFILPPSTRELERRLQGRAQDTDDVVARRMSKAPEELSHWAEYGYIVINDDLDACLRDVQAILRAEMLKRGRQPGLAEFVKSLIAGQ